MLSLASVHILSERSVEDCVEGTGEELLGGGLVGMIVTAFSVDSFGDLISTAGTGGGTSTDRIATME